MKVVRGASETRRTSDSGDLEAGSDLSRQTALGAAQHNVEELLRRGHGLDVLPSRLHGGGGMEVVVDGGPLRDEGCRLVTAGAQYFFALVGLPQNLGEESRGAR